SSRRRHTRWPRDWSSDVCSSDLQTLSLLAPYLKLEYHWSNTDYANLVIAFRVAYSVGQTIFGRFMDRVGTRRGLSISVAFYSLRSEERRVGKECSYQIRR